MDHQTERQQELEDLVDALGLKGVCQSLAEICWAKAEHIRSNWQDEPLAKAWGKAAAMLERVATRIPV
jgi:hypothetical protein